MKRLSNSEAAALSFYRRLGVDRMQRHVPPASTAATLKWLAPLLPPGCRVLDLGCGYGRIALPLAKRGYRLTGLDLSPNLLKEAKDQAEERGLKARWDIGDMRRLPYAPESFDAVVCLWSSLNHLLTREDQQQAVGEALRVLAPGGWALFEVADGGRKDLRDILKKSGQGPDRRVWMKALEGIPNPEYLFDLKTLEALAAASPASRHTVAFQTIAGRRRLAMRLWK